MNEKIKAFIGGLSPELREKAENIKTQEELNEFLAENDIELPEEALESVSGGCEEQNSHEKGYVYPGACPDCGGDLIYHDNINHNGTSTPRAHCAGTGVLYYRTKANAFRQKWVVYPK